MRKILLSLFFAFSIIEWIRILMEWDFEHFSKPMILFSLLIYFIYSSKVKDTSFYIFVAALIFSWFGDALLMYQQSKPIYFLLGLGSFLITHVLYALTFKRLKNNEAVNPLLPTQKLRHGLVLTLAGVALLSVLSPTLGDLRFPVTIYTAVIVFMAIMALLRYGFTSTKSFALIFGGAVLFIISDATLAINKFLEPVPLAGFWVMLTYCVAQFIITEGVLAHQKQSK